MGATTHSVPELLAVGRELRVQSREIKAEGRNVRHVLVLQRALRAKRRALEAGA